METIDIRKSDLKILLECFDSFVEEDYYSCDYCKWCGMEYGNAALMIKQGKKLTHNAECPYLVAQDLSTGII